MPTENRSKVEITACSVSFASGVGVRDDDEEGESARFEVCRVRL